MLVYPKVVVVSLSIDSLTSAMASRKHRYAVDPSLVSRPDPVQQSYVQPAQYDQQQGYPQTYGQPQPFVQQAPAPQGAYDVSKPRERIWADDLIPPPAPFAPSTSPPVAQAFPGTSTPLPPANHIPQPPHAAGPSLRGPRPRLDPTQVPSAVDAAEMDQNLYDQEDFESCNTKGLVPLGTTDYRGVDQGE
jgi:protein transport protein SEC24